MKQNNYLNGFTSIRNEVVVELKAHLFRTYSYLLSKDYNNKGIFHSQETMAKELGVSIRTIQRHLKELKELGYITFRRRGFNQTNIYHMLKGIVSKVKEVKEELTNNFKKQFTSIVKPKSNKLKFDNFQGRNYSKEDWDSLERKLLGWE